MEYDDPVGFIPSSPKDVSCRIISMSPKHATSVTEGAIWGRLLQLQSKRLNLEAARSLLRLDFAPEDKERMHELAAKARDGSLGVEEQEEIRNYERVGNLLALMKSNARQRLKQTSSTNGSQR